MPMRVQYYTSTDITVATLLANAFSSGNSPVITEDINYFPTYGYDSGILVGGQGSNPLFANLVSRGIFRNITEADSGRIVIQVGTVTAYKVVSMDFYFITGVSSQKCLNPNKYVYAGEKCYDTGGYPWYYKAGTDTFYTPFVITVYSIAGWTPTDTAAAADYVIRNGLPSSSIDIPAPVPVPGKALGETVNVSLGIQNTGDTDWTYGIGCSVKDVAGNIWNCWSGGTALANSDPAAGQIDTHFIPAGQTITHVTSFPNPIVQGEVSGIFKVWKESVSPPATNLASTGWVSRIFSGFKPNPPNSVSSESQLLPWYFTPLFNASKGYYQFRGTYTANPYMVNITVYANADEVTGRTGKYPTTQYTNQNPNDWLPAQIVS